MNGTELYSFISSPSVKVMGILNLTPDSFYDGGRYDDPKDAVRRMIRMREEGADIIDIGAESTRPGSDGIAVEEEIRRLTPVLEEGSLRGAVISLDTRKPAVAEHFLKRGNVHLINDVGGLRDKEMMRVVREFDVPAVIMHMYGTPKDMQKIFGYSDVVNEIIAFFKERTAEASHDKLILDPGIGFGKSVENNLDIIKRLGEFTGMGYPVMIGASRKSFIGKILGLEPSERLEGSLAAMAAAVLNGARIVRVHDVKESVRVKNIIEAIKDVSYKEVQV